MPLLPKEGYSAQVGGLPISGGMRASMEDPLADAARGFAGTLSKASDALMQQREEEQARKALVGVTEIRASYAAKTDEAARTGADLDKLKEEMNAEIAKIGEGFDTKKGTQSLRMYTANTNLMFDEQANKIKAQRAFADAQLDGHKLINSSSAIIAGNPAYLKVAEENVDALVATFSKLRADQRVTIADQLKKELNLSAAVSAARADPKGTIQRLQDGDWNLTPAQREHALKRANTEFLSQRAEQSYIEAQAEKRVREQNSDAYDEDFKGIMAGDPGMRRKIMDDPRLLPQTREHLILFMENRAEAIKRGEKASDPKTKLDLYLRIGADENDPSRIYTEGPIMEAVRAGKLSTTDADRLRDQVQKQRDSSGRTIGMKTNTAVSVVGRALSADPQFTAQPALVAEIQNDYIDRVNQRIEDLRQAGDKRPTRVFDIGDPDSVISREFIQGAIDAAKGRQRAAAEGKLPRVNSQEEYDALDDNQPYLDSQGVQAVKHGKAKKPGAPKGPTVTGQISEMAAP